MQNILNEIGVVVGLNDNTTAVLLSLVVALLIILIFKK